MIIVRLAGGLGNQMFQYAAGRAVAARAGVLLRLDTTSYAPGSSRDFGLWNYRIEAEVATEHEIARFLGTGPKSLATRARLRLQRLLPFAWRTLVWERGLTYDSRLSQVGRHAYLAGYWQSEKYFADIANLLRAELVPAGEVSVESLSLADEIRCSRTLSVHVRRGDYVTNPLYGGICTTKYYQQAVASVRKRVPDIRAFVFSDDIGWVESNLDLGVDTIHVRHTQVAGDHEDIWLMSLCQHHVIANSSFSWWGAWLGRNPSKIVIAPDRWLNDASRDARDLVPATWERIQA